ncbi:MULTISPECIES: hypothetical protein [Methylobacterium]|uniref:hypothetical protein n=1 Tax=Methylobacterium TaxID=407 RepID=UPI00272E9D91|nr:hypothetical protein [Methylobacterium sp.]
MTEQELAETRADLASMKEALRRRIGGKALQQVGNTSGSTSETVTYAGISVAELRAMIAEAEVKIRLSSPGGYGAIHVA